MNSLKSHVNLSGCSEPTEMGLIPLFSSGKHGEQLAIEGFYRIKTKCGRVGKFGKSAPFGNRRRAAPSKDFRADG